MMSCTQIKPVQNGVSDCRIAIIDDRVMFREAIQRHCTCELGCTVVGVANSVADAVRLISDRQPNIVLIDLHLSDGDGFAVIEQVRRKDASVVFIALSSHTDDYSTFRAERCEFMGWIDTNTESLNVLGQALSVVVDGKAYYSPSFVSMRRERNRDCCSFVKRLTEKHRSVLGLLGEGLTNEEIASRLGIGVGTVKGHIGAITQGLEISGRSKLIQYAVTRGFTRLRPHVPPPVDDDKRPPVP